MKKIHLSDDFAVDAVEYASRANAILGIRDSGKTYTATRIAEQLFDCSIPFFAFDPIGRWRFLRAPGRVGRGFPVVVLGGAAPDLPLTPDEAPKMMRAAMRSGVSMVVDLYDMKLSKKDWRAVVRGAIETVLYENEEHRGGLRHVFLEEAAEFAPQRVYDGRTYAAVEKLVRMGGNAGVGVTLINQRAEEVNKAVLELCDNLLLHRQRGKNSLLSLRKWLEAGNVQPPREITDSLADLPTGQCWAWFKDVGRPRLIEVARKQSFDPNRRAMSAHTDAPRPVDVTAFVEEMRAALAGKKVAIKPAQPVEDKQVDEKEARALRAENERLERTVARQDNEIRGLKVQVERLLSEGQKKTGPTFAAQGTDPIVSPGAPLDMDAIYAEVRRRAVDDPGLLRILTSRPEIEVAIERRTIQASDKNLLGKVAILISEGFFNDGATANSAFAELRSRGNKIAVPSVYRECDKIAALGFLRKESKGYRSVEGMKVNIVEA